MLFTATAFITSRDTLWVNLYAPSTAEWKAAGLSLAMDTTFPEATPRLSS